jgi:hypothetical protein
MPIKTVVVKLAVPIQVFTQRPLVVIGLFPAIMSKLTAYAILFDVPVDTHVFPFCRHKNHLLLREVYVEKHPRSSYDRECSLLHICPKLMGCAEG